MALGQAVKGQSTPVVFASDSDAMAVTGKLRTVTLESATRTATGTGSTTTGFAGSTAIIFQLAVTAVSGLAANLILVVEDSTDGVNWNLLATFATVTAITAEVKRVTGPFCDKIRTRSVITGTTPSLTFTVSAQSEGGL